MADTAAAAELLVRVWRLTNSEHYRTVAQDALANYAMTFRHFAHFVRALRTGRLTGCCARPRISS